MRESPWPIYTESQIAAAGFAVMDNTIARMLRPSLFIGGNGESADFNQRIERAKADGTLYSAILKTCKPGEEGRPVRDEMGITRSKQLSDRRTVPVIALSGSRLKERLGWLGLDVEAVTPWLEPEQAPEQAPEEVEAREAERRELREKMGLYQGHPKPTPRAA